MVEPTQIISASFGALNSAFQFLKFVCKFQDVPSEAKNFLKLISRVEKDVDEARRLRHDKSSLLDAGLAARVDEAIVDTYQSMKEAGRTIETCRVDMAQNSGGVNAAHRFKWVLKDHQAFLTRERNLNYCHTAILHCITDMNAVRAVDLPPYSASVGENIGYEETLQSPRARKAQSLAVDQSQGFGPEKDHCLDKAPAICVEQVGSFTTTPEAIYLGTSAPKPASAMANKTMEMPSPGAPIYDTGHTSADSDDDDGVELDDRRIEILNRASLRRILR